MTLFRKLLDKWIVKYYLGGDDMVALYVALIVAGRRTLDQVPIKLRDAVRADLEAVGLDYEGKSLLTFKSGE